MDFYCMLLRKTKLCCIWIISLIFEHIHRYPPDSLLQCCDVSKDLYIIRYLLLKYRLIFLWVLKVSDEPLGESNAERRVKISASVSKEGT